MASPTSLGDAPAAARVRPSFASVALACAPGFPLFLSSLPSAPDKYARLPATTAALSGRFRFGGNPSIDVRRGDEDAMNVISTVYCGPARPVRIVARAGG